MERRQVVKTLLYTGGVTIGLGVLGCRIESTNAGFYSPQEEELISAIVDTIIPGGELPNQFGARSVKVDLYVKNCIEKCYPEDVHTLVKDQLSRLEASAQNEFGQSYTQCGQEAREKGLDDLSNSDDNAKKFLNLLKSETIKGFQTSQHVLVNHYHYTVAPGHYYGCVPVG